MPGEAQIALKKRRHWLKAVKNIMNGNNLVDVTAKQLDEIANSANKVADLVEEIATASKEQTQGLEQINQGLGQIDQVTQGNTANAEESASAAEELAVQTQQLKAIVAQFKLAGSEKIDDRSSSKLINMDKKEINKAHAGTTFINKPVEIVKTKASQVVNPKQIIKLDDDDFGKF